MTERTKQGPAIGERFAGYVPRELVGTGSMAAVYRADRGPGTREVALKVAHAALAERIDVAARFEREAKTISRLCHPLCVRLYDWGTHQGLPYVAVELVHGTTLADLVADGDRLDPLFVVRLVLELCDLLSAAHTIGVVHRDLKPTNVMLVGASPAASMKLERPPIKLLDFGVAKIGVLSPQGEKTPSGDPLTAASAIVGTPTHMAPELVTGGMVDGRTDLYACGVLLYQMVTGELPFKGRDALRVALSQVSEQPKAPRRIVPDLPANLEAIIMQCLRKLPEERPHSAWELGRRLQSVVLALTSPASQ